MDRTNIANDTNGTNTVSGGIPYRGHWCDLPVAAFTPVFDAMWPLEQRLYDAFAQRWDAEGESPPRLDLVTRKLGDSNEVQEVVERFERFRLVRIVRSCDARGRERAYCVPGNLALSLMGRYRSTGTTPVLRSRANT